MPRPGYYFDGMGDCLQTGKPCRYVTNHTGQLSLLSVGGRWIKYRPAWRGLRWGAFTCVWWQVTLCDQIRQVTLCSSEVDSHDELYLFASWWMLQAMLIGQCVEAKLMTLNYDVFVNFVGASPASCNIVAVLRRFCYELTSRFQLSAVASIDDYASVEWILLLYFSTTTNK